MIPRRVPNPRREPVSGSDVCDLADRLGADPRLIHAIIEAAGDLPFEIWIFSGARTRARQEAVSSTPFDVSTHADHDQAGCPRLATGVDVQPVLQGIRSIPAAVAQMGAAFVHHGLRWGGGAPVGEDGIPVGVERWHVDLGPRTAP